MLAMSQKLLDQAKKSATNALETFLKKVIQKTVEGTRDLIGNKIIDRITKVPKNSQQNNSKTVINEHYQEIPKERYVPQEKRREIIDDLRLK